MTTTRSYRKGMAVADAVAEVRRCAGTQFDPAVADALLAVVGDPGWELTLREPAAPAAPVARPAAAPA
jgi:HD-GYP domain-containing protein (c-di-GMP phosphodiesterase class II)